MKVYVKIPRRVVGLLPQHIGIFWFEAQKALNKNSAVEVEMEFYHYFQIISLGYFLSCLRMFTLSLSYVYPAKMMNPNWQIHTVDGSEILHHLGCKEPLQIMGRNHQPQLVSWISSSWINSIFQICCEKNTANFIRHPGWSVFNFDN